MAKLETTLIWLIMSAFIASSGAMLESKNQSSFTIALVGPFGWYPGLQADENREIISDKNMDLSLVSDGILPYHPYFGFFWMQAVVQVVVDAINNDPFILPNTKLKLRRFDNSDEFGRMSGGRNIHIANMIAQDYPEVVAVTGELYGVYTKFSAQVYGEHKIPFCGPTQHSSKLLDRAKYPYYFQARTLSGAATTMTLLFKSWNVRRVAVISEYSLFDQSDPCHMFITEARNQGIEIIARITKATILSTDYIARTLSAVDAHYIMICAKPALTASIYYSLAFSTKEKLVGTDYVWTSINIPVPASEEDAITLWGPEYYKAATGIFLLQSLVDPSYVIAQLQNSVDELNRLQARWTDSRLTPYDLVMMGILPSMDCIGILAAGLHNLIEKNPTFAKSQRTSEEFKKELNWTLFQNSGFKGVQSDVLQLSHYGDLDKPFMIGSILDVRQPSMNWYARTDDHRTRLIPMAEGATALFYNNGTNPPLDQTPHIVNQIAKESERGKIIWIFYGTGLGLVGVSILVLLVYRTRQEVRAASFSFTTASILGYAAAYGSNYFYFGVPTAQTCVARIWLLASAFCLIVGSIGLKNARLCMIYKSRTIIPKWKLSDGLWLGFLFGVFSLEQVVLFSWALFSKIHVSQVFMGSNVDYSCEVTYSLMSYILWASNSLLFFYLCTITHTTRNMSHKHSEFGLLLLICISVPLGIFVMLQIGALFQTAVIIWTMVTTILVSQVTPILIQLYASSRSRHWMHQWRNRSLSFNTIKPPLKTDKIPPPQLPESQFVAKWGKNSPMLRQVATIKKCRNLTDSSVSTTSKRKSSLVFDGDFPETSIIKEFPVIICVKQGFGMQSEWLAGSVAINKIGMAVCILFWYRNKDPSEPTSDASMMAFRPKISNNVVDSLRKVDGGWMLSLDTHQGILVLEFEEGEVFEDFKNHLVYSAAI